jgi:hypothetical protein
MFAEKRMAATIVVRLIAFITSANNRDDNVLMISRTKDKFWNKIRLYVNYSLRIFIY